jgi:hypothetical protein
LQLYLVRIASLIVIALVYMLFDVLNKRNVPAVFAYATLIYGFALTLLYFNLTLILESSAISLVILGAGYIFYKIGQLGGADVIELAALSLILPILQFPVLVSGPLQLQLPFIISLAINTGIVALIIVPLYYLPKAKKKLKKPLFSYVERKNVFLGVMLAIVYVAFISFAVLVVGINYIGIIVLTLMLISSFLVMIFSIPITYSMVEYVGVNNFDEGDIVAVNLMDEKSLSALRKKVKGFDKLLTANVIKDMKKSKIKEKLPVYKEAMPFALPIFIAVILCLIVGNLLFFVLGL